MKEPTSTPEPTPTEPATPTPAKPEIVEREPKPTEKEPVIEIITKKQEKPEKPEKSRVTMYKYDECPWCGNEELWYDKTRKIYYCENCGRAFQ